MDIALEVANYLESAGFGTVGTNIFAGQIPDSQNGIYIVRAGGFSNMYIPISETVVDIYVKDTMASDAITTINSIKNFMHRMHTTETSLVYFYSMLLLGDVEDLARDLEGAKIYKITVQLFNRDKSLIS